MAVAPDSLLHGIAGVGGVVSARFGAQVGGFGVEFRGDGRPNRSWHVAGRVVEVGQGWVQQDFDVFVPEPMRAGVVVAQVRFRGPYRP
jgi:hypothetical protein